MWNQMYKNGSKLPIWLLITIVIILSVLLFSCNATTPSEDMEKLQKHYDVVYRISSYQYVVADTTGVYDVMLQRDGTPYSKVKIK
jgi:hypothetical protein